MWRGSLDDAIRYSTETEVSKGALKPARGASGGTSVGVWVDSSLWDRGDGWVREMYQPRSTPFATLTGAKMHATP